MSFTCKYCGKKFCSEHRLPENHNCDSMDEKIEEQKEGSDKWFEEKEVRNRPEPPKKPSLFQDVLRTFRSNMTLTIIATTVLFFILQGFSGVTQFLLLDPAVASILTSPWTLLTVMLVHAGPFHIFANMVTFYFFGTPFEKMVGSRKLLEFYILSGLAASIGYILFHNMLYILHGATYGGGMPTLGPAVGASGAVVAVFGAVAMLYPDAEVLLYFFIPMKVKTALSLFAGLETVNLAATAAGFRLPVLGGFASSAHLAGLAVGVYYGYRLRQRIKTRNIGVLDLMDL